MSDLIAILSFESNQGNHWKELVISLNYIGGMKRKGVFYDETYSDFDVDVWKRFIADLAHLDHPIFDELCPYCLKSLNYFAEGYIKHNNIHSMITCPNVKKSFYEKNAIQKVSENQCLRLEFNTETEAFKPLIEFAKQWNIPFKIGE